MQDFLVSGLRKLVERTADDFDPALLSGLTATRAIEEWARIEKIACSQKLRSAARAEDVGLDAEAVVSDSSGVSTGEGGRRAEGAGKAEGDEVTRGMDTSQLFDSDDLLIVSRIYITLICILKRKKTEDTQVTARK